MTIRRERFSTEDVHPVRQFVVVELRRSVDIREVTFLSSHSLSREGAWETALSLAKVGRRFVTFTGLDGQTEVVWEQPER